MIQNRKRFRRVDLTQVVQSLARQQRRQMWVTVTMLAALIGYSASYAYKILHYLESLNVVHHEPWVGWRVA